MKVSVALSAPPFDPEHGASRNSIPSFANCEETFRLSAGDTVLQSTMVSAPDFPAASPSLPRMTSFDISVLPTQRKTHSLRFATSAGVAQAVAPSLASCSALPLECDHKIGRAHV